MSTSATPTLTPAYLESEFARAKSYADHVAMGNPSQQEAWKRIHEQASLTDQQTEMLGGFVREMKVLVLSGVWCGDCAQQVPFVDLIHRAAAEGTVDVRYGDRDEHAELMKFVTINQGARVPVAIFMAEDFERCSLFGDRTLTRYRAMAERTLGAACMVPGAPLPDDEVAGTLAEWVNEFERVQLMLRLSGRLRQKHGD
ncbi:MAG: thioredoxin family protein [Planctomycetota bacterium]